MRVQKFGHACLLVTEGDTSVLIDPGAFSPGWETITGLAAVLVTHQHPDHLDTERLPTLLKANPDARLYVDAGSAAAVGGNGWDTVVVTNGDQHEIGDITVDVVGRDHAVIHSDIPLITNVGYLLTAGGRNLFHPGDAFTVPDRRIDTLALPVSAPWAKLSEVVEYLRAVHPRVALPIHEAVYAMPEMIAYRNLRNLKPAETTFTVIDDGVPVEI